MNARSETVLLQLRNYLSPPFGQISTRRAAIFNNEKEVKSHLSLIQQYLAMKYHLPTHAGFLDVPTLKEAQRNLCYSELNKKF